MRTDMAKEAGFNLVELMVVISMIGILIVTSIPLYRGYLDKAQESIADQTLHFGLTALEAGAMDLEDADGSSAIFAMLRKDRSGAVTQSGSLETIVPGFKFSQTVPMTVQAYWRPKSTCSTSSCVQRYFYVRLCGRSGSKNYTTYKLIYGDGAAYKVTYRSDYAC